MLDATSITKLRNEIKYKCVFMFLRKNSACEELIHPSDALWHHGSSQHWFRKWLGSWWHQANAWTSAKLTSPVRTCRRQWNSVRNSNIFIRENAFEILVLKISAILYRPQYLKSDLNPQHAVMFWRRNTIVYNIQISFNWLNSEVVQIMLMHSYGR